MAKKLLAALLVFAHTSYAQTEETYDYPELLVVPRATKRLSDEAKQEEKSAWRNHLPIQISALSTIAASTMVMGERKEPGNDYSDAHYAGLSGMVIGSGWLAATVGLSLWYRPYADGVAELKKMGGKSKEDQLYRERIAEESLYAPAYLATLLKYGSVVSNLAANVAMAGGTKDQDAKIYAGVAALLALGPLFFEYPWEDVYDNQMDYKKRIYGPLSLGPALMTKPDSSSLFPGLNLVVTL
jgi:hypothetical protein